MKVGCSFQDKVSLLENAVECWRMRGDLAANSGKAVTHRVMRQFATFESVAEKRMEAKRVHVGSLPRSWELRGKRWHRVPR